MKLFSCVAFVFAIVASQVALPAEQLEELRSALRESRVNNDGERMKRTAKTLRKVFEGHPTYIFYEARAEAMLDRPLESIVLLKDALDRGANMLPATEADAAFDAVRALPEFKELQSRAEVLERGQGTADVAWQFGVTGAVSEGVAVDPTGCVYLSNVSKGSVLSKCKDTGLKEWFLPEGWSAQGMHFSPDMSTLWVATSAMNVSETADESDHGRTALVALDPIDGDIYARHELDRPGNHALGDFIFVDDTNLVATDGIGGGIYSLDTETGEYTDLVGPGRLRSPQGIALLGDTLIVADYGYGLYRLDPSEKTLLRIGDGPASPYGIDGLYAYEGALIAVQNGIRPQRVARLRLAEDLSKIVGVDVLLTNHPQFDEPTLGEIHGGMFYLVANSHWNRVGQNGEVSDELSAPTILSIDLRKASD